MADWVLVERVDWGDGRFTVWLDDHDGAQPGANGIVVGMGPTRDAALLSALSELQDHIITVSRKLADLAIETPHGAH